MRTLRSLALAVAGIAGAAFPLIGTGAAQADPAGFPDLSHLPTDRRGAYAIQMGRYTVALLTPGKDVGCWFRDFTDPAKFDGFTCRGNIPGVEGIPVSDETLSFPCTKVMLSAGEDAGEIQRQEPTCAPDPLPGIVFPSGRKIVIDPVTCGSTGDVLMACINSENEHGFVISRSRTWTF